jgi:arylsulfatase A-like enzyme
MREKGKEGVNRREFLRLIAASICSAAIGCSKFEKYMADKPHIVCVLIDQLRKDSGDRWATQLTLHSQQGIRFEQMRAVAPWTYPSVISMMSGLFPQQHGAHGLLTKQFLTRFSKQVPLIQATLKNLGYQTAAFITNPFLHTWNHFHLNFDFFDAHFIKNTGNIRPTGEAFSIPEKMFSPSVNSSVKKFFSANPVRNPEFTYIHYIDVHGPWKGAPFKPNYKSAIQFIDKQVVEIYRFFMERYDGNVFFFVTSDHGCALSNDLIVGYGARWRKHKFSCHDFNLRIPFFLLPSRNVRRPMRVHVPCSNVDLVPTILDLIGEQLSYHLVGRSLAPWIRGEGGSYHSRPIYSRVSSFGRAFGGYSDALTYEGKKLIRYFDFDDSHIILSRLFDLTHNPRETHAIKGSSKEMERLIVKESGTHGLVFATENVVPPDDDLEMLRSLGYM